jgi:4-hydroxybenzoyl-CoA thioesterase
MLNRYAHVVEWGECDPAGIVFYPQYFALFDACTHALFERGGIGLHELTANGSLAGIPVVALTATFMRSMSPGAKVDIETEVVRWGRSSFDVRHQLVHAGTVAVQCTETRVWTVREAGRLRSDFVPDWVREPLR